MIDEQLFCILQDTVHRWIFASTWHRLSAVKPYLTDSYRFIQTLAFVGFCKLKDTEGQVKGNGIQATNPCGIHPTPKQRQRRRHRHESTNLPPGATWRHEHVGSSLGAVFGTSEIVCWSFNKMIPLSSVARSNQVSRMMNPECPWHFHECPSPNP